MSEPESGPSPAGQGGWSGHARQETAYEADMMDAVREAGPDSEEAAYLRHFLDVTGLAVLMELHRNGLLLGRMRTVARTPLPPPPYDWQQSATGLIYAGVQRSLEPFFAGAVFGEGECRWQPGRASVRDYFVNKCIFTLKDLYLQECKKYYRAEIPCGDLFNEDHDAGRTHFGQVRPEDPEMVSVHGDELRNMRLRMTELQAQIALAKANGWSHKEIGLKFKMTEDAVSSTLWRMRRRFDR